jgi:hypothetical protein
MPDRHRERSARDRISVDREHRDLAVGITHPDRCREITRVADKPGIGVILGGAGLAGIRVLAVTRAGAGAVQRILCKHVRDLVGDTL